MIKVYEFKLSQDGKKLWIHVAANRVSPTTDAVLNTITISVDGDPNGTSAKAFGLYLASLGIVTNTGTSSAPIWTIEQDYQQEIAYNIDLEEVGTVGACSYLNQLYYMQVTATSDHSTCVTVDDVCVITFDKYPIYKAIGCAMNSLVGCETPKLVADYLMKLKAMEAYIALGIDYKEDINNYYDWLIHSIPLMEVTTRLRTSGGPRPCGCGRR